MEEEGAVYDWLELACIIIHTTTRPSLTIKNAVRILARMHGN